MISPCLSLTPLATTSPLTWLGVTFEWNILLDLSGEAATKTFGSLVMKLLLQILSQSTGAMTVWMIRDDEGMGDISGVRGVQGGL